MAVHLAFLRAINLGKNRRVPMGALRTWLGDAGFGEVETYLHTGNVKVTSPTRSRRKVEAELERLLLVQTGFEVPTMVLSPRELSELYAAATALDVTAQRRYVTFLKDEPTEAQAAEIDAWSAPGEGAKVLGRAVLWWLDHPTAAAKLSNAKVEGLTGPATTRDLKVVTTLAERWGR